MTSIEHELPEHVRRIIDRDGSLEFTPPSFERWLGRLVMIRTLASMGGFATIALLSANAGMGWEASVVRGMVAAIVCYFFAWAAALFVFGELYDAEVKRARVTLEEQERDRARRIEEYYRERLRAQAQGEEPFIPGVHEPTAADLASAVTQAIQTAPPTPPPSASMPSRAAA